MGWKLETSKTAKMVWDLIYKVEYQQGEDFSMKSGEIAVLLGKKSSKHSRKHINAVLYELTQGGYIMLEKVFDGAFYYKAKIRKKFILDKTK